MDHQTLRACLEKFDKDDSPEQFARALDALISHEQFPPTRLWRRDGIAWAEWDFTGDAAPLNEFIERHSRVRDWCDRPDDAELMHQSGALALPEPPRLSERYHELGWVLLPLVDSDNPKKRGKACLMKGWKSFTETPKVDWSGKNVGVKLGAVSGALVDIDLDGPYTPQIGELLFADLPSSGRKTSMHSHRWFVSDDGTAKTEQLSLGKKTAESLGIKSDKDKAMLVEVRGDGAQTMIPPSVHPDTGETVEWHGGFPDTFPVRNVAEMTERATLCALLSMVALGWPGKGNRDNCALALAGALLRYKFVTPELCDALVGRVAKLGGDPERRDNKAESTLAKLEADEPVTGWQTVFELCEFTGEVLKAARKFAGSTAKSEAPPGTVVIEKGDLDNIVREIEQRLLASDELIFQRAQFLVRVLTVPDYKQEDGVVLPAGTLLVQRIRNRWLERATDRHVKFVKFNAKAMAYLPEDPPPKHIAALLDSAGEWSFPVLNGITNTPILLPNGDIVREPGFHESTGLYLDTKGIDYPEPTDDLNAAKELLLSPFKEYGWLPDTPGMSIVLSAILCVLCRNLVPFVPAHAFDALYPGSGKSNLFLAIAELVLGHASPSVVLTSSEQENQKRLETALMKAPQMLMLDNVSQELGGELLCQATTKDVIALRILGVNEEVYVKNSVVILINGNGLVFFGDFTRRVLRGTIDPGRPDPQNAQFAFIPVDVVRRHRPQMVMAALTIVREYLLAGCPNMPPDLGSFEDYSLIRGALMHVGLPDPIIGMQKNQDDDPELQLFRELLLLWPNQKLKLSDIGTDGLMGGDSKLYRMTELLRLLADAERFDARKAGVVVRQYIDREVDFGDHLLVLRTKDDRKGIKEYWVERRDKQEQLC